MRRTMIALLALLALVGAACGSDDPTVPTSPTATAEPTGDATETEEPTDEPTEDCEDQTGQDQIEVDMVDNAFDPVCLTVNETQPSLIRNQGDAAHTFTIPDTEVDIELGPGEQHGGEGFGLAPGDYVYYCRFHGSPAGSGMSGTMTVA